MAHITIEPVTADRFDDAQHALTGGGDGRSCQCQWWTITNAEFQRTPIEVSMRVREKRGRKK